MTQETSVANRVLSGLEAHQDNRTRAEAQSKNFGMDDSMDRGDNLELNFSMNESQDQSILQEAEDDGVETAESPAVLQEQGPGPDQESQAQPRVEESHHDFSKREPFAAADGKSGDNTIEPEVANIQLMDDITAIHDSVKEVYQARTHNLEFKDLVEPYPFVQDLLNSDLHAADAGIASGRRLICLRDKGDKSFTVYSTAREGEQRTVQCYLAARSPEASIVGLHLMDDLDEDFSVVLCMVKAERVTVVPYKVGGSLHISLYQCEFGLEDVPRKVAINKSWCCLANDKADQRMRLLSVDSSLSMIDTGAGRHYPRGALTSRLVDLESSSELLQVDISSEDGLLLLTYASGLHVKDSTGRQSKLSLQPHQRDEVVYAKLVASGSTGASEYLLCLELGQGHIFEIEDRSVGNFRVAHRQTFSTGVGLGGPKFVRLYSQDIFLSSDYLIILFREDFYSVAFWLDQEGVARRPVVSAMAKFNHKPQERDQIVRFVETGQDRLLPLCFSKNFSSQKLVYKLRGLLDRGSYSERLKSAGTGECLAPGHASGPTRQGDDAESQTEKSLRSPRAEVGGQNSEPKKVAGEPEIPTSQTDQLVGDAHRNDATLATAVSELRGAETAGDDRESESQASTVLKQGTSAEHGRAPEELAVAAEQSPARVCVSESDDEAEETIQPSRVAQEQEQASRTLETQPGLTDTEAVRAVADLQEDVDTVSQQEGSRLDNSDLNNQQLAHDAEHNTDQLDDTQQAESFLREQLFSSMNETRHIQDASRDMASELVEFGVSASEERKPQAFEDFLKNENLLPTAAQQPRVRARPDSDSQSEYVRVSPEDPRQQKRGETNHKTHSATPEPHGSQKKTDVQKASQPKKNDKTEYKKKPTKGKKERDSEVVAPGKKYAGQEKSRADKYDDFVPKEIMYREKEPKEKEPKEKERAKDSYSPVALVCPPESFYSNTGYVPKVRDLQKNSSADATGSKSQQKDAGRAAESQKPAGKVETASGMQIGLAQVHAQLSSVLGQQLREAVSEVQAAARDAVLDEDRLQQLIVGIVDRYVDERLIKTLKDNFNCLMSNNYNEVFEDLVVPCFEKYLVKVFDKTNSTFERGLKYFCDKLLIEEKKVNQIREQMTLMTNQFSSQMKSAAKVSQDFGQVSKEILSSQHKDLAKRVASIEEQLEKLHEKTDKSIDLMERIWARMEEKEQDKKVEVPPALSNSAILEQMVELMRSSAPLQHIPPPATFAQYAHPAPIYGHHPSDHLMYRQPPSHAYGPSTPPLHYSIASGLSQHQYVMTPPSSNSYTQHPQLPFNYTRSGTSTPLVAGEGYLTPRAESRSDPRSEPDIKELQARLAQATAKQDDRQ